MVKLKLLKKIFYLSLIAMQIIALGPTNKALSKPNNKDAWELNTYKNADELKVKILKDPEFIRSWAIIAHILGFAWCEGTGSPHVGEDYSFERSFEKDDSGASHEVYYLRANYNSSHDCAKKSRANERLQMKISNVRLIIEPTTLKFGSPKTIEMEPITIASGILKNTSNKDSDTSISFTYASNKSWYKSNEFKLNDEIGVKANFSVDIPLSKNKESTLNVEFGTEKGFKQLEEIAMTEMKSIQYYDKVQAKSKRQIDLIGIIKKSEVPYKARIYIEYDMTFTGFLRERGNAHVDHPTDRPTKSITFGRRNGMSATEDLLDMYNNRDIKGYSEWDWQWIIANFSRRNIESFVEEFCTVKRGGEIKGVFNIFEGNQIAIKASDQKPIDTMIKDYDSSKEHKVEVKDFKSFKTPGFDTKGLTINR